MFRYTLGVFSTVAIAMTAAAYTNGLNGPIYVEKIPLGKRTFSLFL